MSSAPGPPLSGAIRELPELLRKPVGHWIERLTGLHPAAAGWFGANPAEAGALLRLVAQSEFAAAVLIREWDWFVAMAACAEPFPAGPDLQRVVRESVIQNGQPDVDGMQLALRRFRNRRLLQILWRECRIGAALDESLASLSLLADVLVDVCVEGAAEKLAARFGIVADEQGRPVPLIVLAMGKLGGRELNFSSDIDLVFLYSGETDTDGERQISAHEYFTRLARQVVQLLDEATADGFVYRVDTRLRPFGDSGPPVVSIAALEAYLLQHGRSWERYAYIKARVIGPAAGSAAAADLLGDLVQPFVYRRYLDYGVFESLRDMHALIAAEVQKRELANNVKLGPGGIREIEFIVQSLQLVRGGADDRLRNTNLLTTLPSLTDGRGLSKQESSALAGSYRFLRRFENALQAIRDQQTHEMPEREVDRARLALALGYPAWAELHDDLERHRAAVSERFSAVAFRTGTMPAPSELGGALTTLWESAAPREDWVGLLLQHGYREAHEIATEITRFAGSGSLRQIDGVAEKRLSKFIAGLLQSLRERQQSSLALSRVLQIVQQILRRSAYVALLNENPAVLERLVGLCEKSAYLAAEISRFPLLLDEMLDPRLFSAELTAAVMQADLEQRLARLYDADSERAIEVLAQFQRATLFRIAVADVSGNLPIMQVSDRLTELAEIVLRQALQLAWRDLAQKYGEPGVNPAAARHRPGFGVIAYGKFGGMELSYRSDLDLVFLHDADAAGQKTDGGKPLENTMFFGRLVRRLVHFLTTQTASGALYEVDTRLRPSGHSGSLVVSVEAFERYQEENAWTWEHQALLRARPVAGSAIVAREFERVRAQTLKNRVRRKELRDDVLSMRGRMRGQLDRSSERQIDLKQGPGGIADIEFIVQYLVLQHGLAHPAVIHYTDNIRQLGTLAAAGCLALADAERLQQIYGSYRSRLHRLALDGQSPLVDSAEFFDEREYVTDIWQRVFTA